MKKILIFFLVFTSFLGIAGLALADTITLPNPLCPGGPGSVGCIDSIPLLIEKITLFVRNVIGGVAILMFVIAGILFVVSAGNPGKIETAKKMAIYAAWGVAIALAGTALVQVIKAVIGAPAT